MLLRHYMRREAGGLLGWSLSLAALVFPMVGLYRLMMNGDGMRELNRMIEQLPPAVKSMVGAGMPLNTLDAWIQAQVFGFLVPLMLAVYTAMAALGVLTREMDGRNMDFLLALPVGRASLVLSRLGGLALNLLVMHGVLLLSVGNAVAMIGEKVAWHTYALILVNQYLIYLALAALLVLISVFVDDYQKGLMLTLAVTVAMFFLPHAITSDSPLAPIGRLSLFHYAHPAEVLAHGALLWSDVLVLLGALLVATSTAVWCFDRKQLSA